MASAAASQLINSQTICNKANKQHQHQHLFSAHHPVPYGSVSNNDDNYRNKLLRCSLVLSNHRNVCVLVKSSAGKDGVMSAAAAADDDDGVSLGTMRLPLDIDIARFETLLFQWANSLCQGAQLPLPVPLKVDKIEGGVRLGFVEIDDGKSQVLVYINCVVIPGTNSSDNPPLFRASRNGARKDKVPPGEPRIMKSLLAALQKSVEIARV